MPRARNSSDTSRSTTSNPARAATCAIPLPIVPAPTTPKISANLFAPPVGGLRGRAVGRLGVVPEGLRVAAEGPALVERAAPRAGVPGVLEGSALVAEEE